MKKYFDIGVAWVDPVETAFITELRRITKTDHVSLYEITYSNVAQDYERITKGDLAFNLFIDRASIDNPAFFLMADVLRKKSTRVINNPQKIIQNIAKTNLITKLKKAKIPIAKSFIISPKSRSRAYFQKIIKELGAPFVLNPSYGGMYNEVKTNTKSISDIENYLKDNLIDDYIAHEFISPVTMSRRVAWFRPIYVAGAIIPLWWSPKTHVYKEFGNSKNEDAVCAVISLYITTIAKITGFDLFSTEFVIDKKTGKMLAIDYANHPIDMNTTKYKKDGLPPNVLRKIVKRLVSLID